MKCTQSLSFSEICQLEFLQNCPGSQSLLHTNEFPEFWNEQTYTTAPLRALFADALGRISKTPMGASLSNCLGGVLGGPTASPPPRSPPKPAKAAPTPAKAAHPKSPELLEVFGPEELYPLTDAMEKALKEQQL